MRKTHWDAPVLAFEPPRQNGLDQSPAGLDHELLPRLVRMPYQRVA